MQGRSTDDAMLESDVMNKKPQMMSSKKKGSGLRALLEMSDLSQKMIGQEDSPPVLAQLTPRAKEANTDC